MRYLESRIVERERTASVTIDPDRCIGSAECVRVAPAAFRLDEASGVSTALEAAARLDRATLTDAVRGCPMRAISAIGGDGEAVE
jgi:ferredoxin